MLSLEAAETAALLDTTMPAEVQAFAKALLAHDTTSALETIDRATREGEDLAAFSRDAIELLRRTLVLKAAPQAQLVDMPSSEARELRAMAENATLDVLIHVLRGLLDADDAMREYPHPRVELQIAILRL